MLLCEPITKSQKTVDMTVVIADQLHSHGWDVGLRRELIEVEGVHRNQQFDVLRHARENLDGVETVLLITDGKISDSDLVSLRRINLPERARILIMVPQENEQAKIGVQAKLSYILNRDVHPVEISIKDLVPARRAPGADLRGGGRLRVLLAYPNLDGSEGDYLRSFANHPEIQFSVLTSGDDKRKWQKAYGHGIDVWQPGEIMPRTLANMTDILAVFSEGKLGFRGGCMLASLRLDGVPIVNASGVGIDTLGQAELIGPRDLRAFIPWVETQILPRRAMIGAEISSHSKTVPSKFIEALEEAMGGDGQRSSKQIAPVKRNGIAFMPTNGVGLGHAQRCSLVADHLSEKSTFLAFPSCLKMLELYGNDTVPLVSRSKLHAEEHANDLLNATRISAVAKTSRALVFDGGYVFDSIVRSALDDRTPSVWIRRGMWQAGQDNSIALDREKVFSRTIVPLELFEELNQNYSRGAHVREVGPIVQRQTVTDAQRTLIRNRLAEKYGAFDKLVVTMLGGGVAADRSAQTISLCGSVEAMEGVLHLVVCWPTAVVPPGVFGWSRTRVIQTHLATTLTLACDAFISAVGYNSFHESMYNAVPTIFLPQMNSFMDDQAARAKAAARRDLAFIADPEELLSLGVKLRAMLFEGEGERIRKTLQDMEWPEPGQAMAARHIEEIMA